MSTKKKTQSFLERASGILGINARNLLYVSRFNSRANKKFADDKLFTKSYLQSRGVGVAKVYNIIKSHKQLHDFDFNSLPDSFVVKPNHGYGGEGIMVIVEKKYKNFISISGKEITPKDLYRHIISILDGKYAISGLSDQTIIEERLVVHDELAKFCVASLPDIRVLVFNYVPIMVMLRLPTDESDGKANLHMGAVGVGIDIATGRATYAVQHNHFITKLPNGEKIDNIKIPNWDELLLFSAQAQHASQIGFLAVDLAVSTVGAKILELNVRAGLSVQIANQAPLRARLKKVADLNVPNPKKGVEIAKTLFSTKISVVNKELDYKDNENIIICLYEYLNIVNSKYENVLMKIDPYFEEALFDKTMTDLPIEDDFVEVKLKGKRLTLPIKFTDFSNEKYKAVVGGKFLHDFLIDLSLHNKISKPEKNYIQKKVVNEKIVKNIDKKLLNIEAQINIIRAFRPVNLDQEKENFLSNSNNSPKFFYKKVSDNIEQLRREIQGLPKNFDHPLSKLYISKMNELLLKLDLLESVNSSRLQEISEKLFGKVTKSLYRQAIKYIKDNPLKLDDSKMVNTKHIIKVLENFLKSNKLSRWKVKVQDGGGS